MKINPWNVRTDQLADQLEEGRVVRWEGQEWQLVLFREGTRFFGVRQLNAGGSAPIWHIGQGANMSLRVISSPNNLSLEDFVLEALKEKRLKLAHHTNADLELRSYGEAAANVFTLNAQGQGLFIRERKGDNYSKPTYFFWSSPSKNLSLDDPLMWWRILREELNDPNSDVSFAYRLAHLSPTEQDATIWKWKHGDYETACRVLQAAFLSQDEIWDKGSWYRWYVSFPLRDGNRYGQVTSENDSPDPLFPSELQAVAELVHDYFAPSPDEHLMQVSLCVQMWQEINPLKFFIGFNSPTMHERLEAKLYWRDWQKKIGG